MEERCVMDIQPQARILIPGPSLSLLGLTFDEGRGCDRHGAPAPGP